jgi:hypothetical protein
VEGIAAHGGATPLSQAAFLQLLDLTLPRPQVPPFELWDLPVSVHLVIFVHRVTGLEPGLYIWVRDLQQLMLCARLSDLTFSGNASSRRNVLSLHWKVAICGRSFQFGHADAV